MEGCRFFKDRKGIIETSDEEIEANYDRVDKIISLMNLGKKRLIVLNARLQGVPYTQIAAILHGTTGGFTALDKLCKDAILKLYRIRTGTEIEL